MTTSGIRPLNEYAAEVRDEIAAHRQREQIYDRAGHLSDRAAAAVTPAGETALAESIARLGAARAKRRKGWRP